MLRTGIVTFTLAAALAAPASAAVTLIAKGTISGSAAGPGLDLSGLSGNVEDGTPAASLGGIGSGLAYAGGNTFVAVPDRGPNATTYNPAIDNTTSYISRFQTLNLALTASGATGAGTLPFTLSPTLTNTTLLYSTTPLAYGTGTAYNVPNGAPAQNDATHNYFTGRSDNFAPGVPGNSANSQNPANARFDPESVRVSNDGKSVFISDEYGPYVRQFDRTTGALLRTYAVPTDLTVAVQGTTTASESAPNNSSGRVANKGMEGLALTPDGKTLVGILQAPTIQDASGSPTSTDATKNMLRIVTIDVATGATKEYGYQLTTGTGVSDIVAINDHQFLVDERDGKGLGDVNKNNVSSNAVVKQIFAIDTTGAQDITGLTGDATQKGAVTKQKTPFLDLVQALTANGYAANTIPSKIEGIAFGQDVTLNGQTLHTLYVANDNDFSPSTSGTNQFFVFGFTDADLAAATGAVPEPATWAMMLSGFGLVGSALRGSRRRTAVRFG